MLSTLYEQMRNSKIPMDSILGNLLKKVKRVPSRSREGEYSFILNGTRVRDIMIGGSEFDYSNELKLWAAREDLKDLLKKNPRKLYKKNEKMKEKLMEEIKEFEKQKSQDSLADYELDFQRVANDMLIEESDDQYTTSNQFTWVKNKQSDKLEEVLEKTHILELILTYINKINPDWWNYKENWNLQKEIDQNYNDIMMNKLDKGTQTTIASIGIAIHGIRTNMSNHDILENIHNEWCNITAHYENIPDENWNTGKNRKDQFNHFDLLSDEDKRKVQIWIDAVKNSSEQNEIDTDHEKKHEQELEHPSCDGMGGYNCDSCETCVNCTDYRLSFP